MVIAGPGSGKTEVLALRVARILQQTHAQPSNILCLTFTESAASNMRTRLAQLIGAQAYRVAIHTFHSFSVEVINRHPEFFYGGANMQPADDVVRLEIIEGALRGLPHGHPLGSVHPQQGYVFAKPVLRAIEHLKKAGLEPDDFKKIIESNERDMTALDELVDRAFSERMSSKQLPLIQEVLSAMKKLPHEAQKTILPNLPWRSYQHVVVSALSQALGECAEVGDVTALSAWKTEWTQKGDDGKRHLKDAGDRLVRMKEVSSIYNHYRHALYDRGYFDFDDMILDVADAALKNTPLAAELQEQYQYMLVDEFQDTNEAQMRLVRIIADAPVNEGRPNIMVVGDDDQAIYRFQGADISNILSFSNVWKDVALVTMTDNYRSTQPILDAASSVIKRGVARIESILPTVEKILVAANSTLAPGDIKHWRLPTASHQYHFVAKEIRRCMERGIAPDAIAVIARTHRELEDLVPYLRKAKVPIRYEREQNVFEEPHIKQLITLARFLVSVGEKNLREADEYLPAILSYPFWGVSRLDVWQVANEAYKNRKSWLEVMRSSSVPLIRDIGLFLIDVAIEAKSQPLGSTIDRLVGAHVTLYDEDDETLSLSKTAQGEFISPFKSYYFNKERFLHARAEYVSFLSSLRTFINALREYRRGTMLSLHDLVAFVEIREKNNLPLNDLSPFSNALDAVSLLSAHKAKGLEFQVVFVLSCLDAVWAGRGESKKLALPQNLPIEPAGDTDDDKIRLFYVALTRAKEYLYLTSYDTKDDGRETSPLRYLLSDAAREAHTQFNSIIPHGDSIPDTSEVLEASFVSFHSAPYRGEEEALLRHMLQEYRLSVTHLNNFLDVVDGGPQKFLENNLLRFPQAKTPASAYGTAVHEALARSVASFKKTQKRPAVTSVIKWFTEALQNERLSERDFLFHSVRGEKALALFYEKFKHEFTQTDLVEVDFSQQGVVIDGAHLVGKIDYMKKMDGGALRVADYKTGRAYISWDTDSDDERRKLRNYRRQLLFYKLLVEQSRTFSGSSVEQGVLYFVEPQKGVSVDLALSITKEETERLAALVARVWHMIRALQFPDVTAYAQNLSGVEAFEEDILSGKFDSAPSE